MGMSILVPTYKRHNKLSRILAYYENSGIPVFVADGSPDEYAGRIPENVRYFHLDSMPFATRLNIVLEEVGTPHVSLLADDDFIDPGFISRADELLGNRPDCSAVFGRCYAFQEGDGANWIPIYDWAEGIEDATPIDRLKSYFTKYFPLFYAPTRTDLLAGALRGLSKLPDRAGCLIELMLSARLVAGGKVIVLDDICAGREVPIVQRSTTVYPGLDQIFLEMPMLINEVNGMLNGWVESSDKSLFEKCLYDPYVNHFIPWHAKRHADSGPVRRVLNRYFGKNPRRYLASSSYENSFALNGMHQFIRIR